MTSRPVEAVERLEAWLIRTVVNLSHDHYRRQAVVARHDPDFERQRPRPGSPEDALVAKSTLAAAIAALPARTRDVLLLHELDGLEPPEIAARLGVRPVTVRWHLAKARRGVAGALSTPEDDR